MIVSIVNQKGGTGKTTTTVNLGSGLAQEGKKVLLVDMDAQGNLSYSLGQADFKVSMSEVLLGESEAEHAIIHDIEGLDILPSNIDLANTEFSLADVSGREFLLKEVLDTISEGYDYILIDCPPSLSLLTINALNASEQLLIPMQMEVLALQGLDLITTTVNQLRKAFNPALKIMGILPVMVDSRRKLSVEVYDYIKSNYEIKIFESKIRNNVKASEAPSFGQSVITYDSTSNSAKDYMAFTKEFLKLNQ